MQIPETDNIHFQYAFKKGYRLALEGKTLNSMPSEFRMDMEKRDYFHQGFDQGKDDLANSDMYGAPICWRCRLAWIAIMIMGGIATAYLIIHNYEKEQAELAQQHQIQIEQAQAKHDTTNPPTELGLLSASARADLAKNRAEQALADKKEKPLAPIVPSTIKVQKATVTTAVNNQQPVNDFAETIPKYVREVYFHTQLLSAKEQTIYHRWRYNSRYLDTIPLKITSDNQAIWSSKKMSSAWQGQWDLEVLNSQQQVIYRKSFTYGAQK